MELSRADYPASPADQARGPGDTGDAAAAFAEELSRAQTASRAEAVPRPQPKSGGASTPRRPDVAPPREALIPGGHAPLASLQHAVASTIAEGAASTAARPELKAAADGSDPATTRSGPPVTRLAGSADGAEKYAGVETPRTRDRHTVIAAAAEGGFGVRATAEHSPAARSVEAPSAVHGRTLEQPLPEASGRADSVQSEVRVQLGSQGWSVQDVTVASLPDGSLSVRLSVDRDETLSVSRRLGELRKRLEAKGLAVGDLEITGHPRFPREPNP